MNGSKFRSMSVAPLGLGVALMIGLGARGAQASGGPPTPTSEPLPERDQLIRQVDELRRAGKLDEAVVAAERALELERAAGSGATADAAEALARLAGLLELAGDWGRAAALRRDALSAREHADGQGHWRTADARLAAALAEKVAGLGTPQREEVRAALRKEEAARLKSRGEFAAAAAVTREAAGVYEARLGAKSAVAGRAWHQVGQMRLRRGDLRGAEEACERAVAIRRAVLPAVHPDLATSLNNLGAVQLYQRNFAAARTSFEEALAIRRAVLPALHLDLARSLSNLGALQQQLGDYEAARLSFEAALKIFSQMMPSDHIDLARCLANLGDVQGTLNEDAAAKQNLTKALTIFRRKLPEGHLDIAVCLNMLGTVLDNLREFTAARRCHEEALAIRRRALDPLDPRIAESLYSLGKVQSDLREHARAKRSHEEALAIRREALRPDDPLIAESLTVLGHVQRELAEYTEAKANLEPALRIFRAVRPPRHQSLASCLTKLGHVQRDLRQYAAARASLEEALTIRCAVLPDDDPEIAISLNDLGIVQLELREYAAAKRSLEEALTRFRRNLSKDHVHIALPLYSLGTLNLASGIDRQLAAPRLAEASDLFMGEMLRLTPVQAEAEQLATAADARYCLELLIDAVLTAGADPGTAYDRVVRAKGSVTARQRWARLARDATDPETVRLLVRLRDVSAAQNRGLSDERAELERRLVEHSEAYRDLQAGARVDGDDVQAALPPSTALVDLAEYWHLEPPAQGRGEPSGELRVVAFVVRPEQAGVQAVPLGSSKDLVELIDGWRASYGAGKAPPPNQPDPGRELRQRLWEPLAGYLEGAEVVLVSPDGPLHGLPWAALPGSREGTYLVHERAFAVAPVPQLLPELLRAGAGGPSDPASLVIGNVDFDAPPPRAGDSQRDNRFPSLPGTEAEAAAVHQLFRAAFAGKRAEMLTGRDAAKEVFASRAPDCSHLLVATHGFFLPEPEREEALGLGRPLALEAMLSHRELVRSNLTLRSGLAFAGANYGALGRGGAFLTALEASELDLRRVDLAVLSACETGLGQVEGGEGVLGLQRAFQLAGARTAVTSLWKVPDNATQALMTHFHRNLWEKRMGKIEALQEAQVWLIQEAPVHPELLRGGLERPEPMLPKERPVPPHYWAAFILSGDWR
jgi:CHAT domain-containing protein/Tfp pilus assembly protein PilF